MIKVTGFAVSSICVFLVIGCASVQDRIYFVPIPKRGWKHVIAEPKVEFYKYESSNKKIYVWPVLYAYDVRYQIIFGIPTPSEDHPQHRGKYIDAIYYKYGKKYHSQNIIAISVNYLGFSDMIAPVPYILLENSEEYKPIDKKYYDRSDVGYGEEHIYFYDVDLSNVDNFKLNFRSESKNFSFSILELKKIATSDTYWDGPIQ